MLEQIHQEKWTELKTLSGNAEHIPNALLDLLTDEEEAFEKAYWKIENHVVVQSDLFEAASVVPKYLEEIYLKSKFKFGVQELLFQIGAGCSEDRVLEEKCFNEARAVFEKLLKNTEIIGTEFEESLKEDLSDLIELHNDRKTPNNEIN